MSRFAQRTTERLELGDGDWVELRTQITYAEWLSLVTALTPAQTETTKMYTDGSPVDAPGPNLAAGNIQLLILTIVSWGGRGFCSQEHDHADGAGCTPRPITKEAIESLDVTGIVLVDWLNEHMHHRTPDFTRASPPGTRATAPSSLSDSSISDSAGDTAGPSTS